MTTFVECSLAIILVFWGPVLVFWYMLGKDENHGEEIGSVSKEEIESAIKEVRPFSDTMFLIDQIVDTSKRLKARSAVLGAQAENDLGKLEKIRVRVTELLSQQKGATNGV